MKKKFPTVFDETCILYDTIYVSAGKVGFQVEAAPDELIKAAQAVTADIITED